MVPANLTNRMEPASPPPQLDLSLKYKRKPMPVSVAAPGKLVSPSSAPERSSARGSEVNCFAPRHQSGTHCGFSLLRAFVKLATMAGRQAKATHACASALRALAHALFTLDWMGWDGGREGRRVRCRAPIQ